MKQRFAWAIVTSRGELAVYDGRAPIYWRRYIAKRKAADYKGYRVVKVTILPVHGL